MAWYSGISLYLANSAAQSAAESGGTTPTTGCHSVIDKPDRVSRVMPPTTTIRKISAQQKNSHTAMVSRRPRGSAAARVEGTDVVMMSKSRPPDRTNNKVPPQPGADKCEWRSATTCQSERTAAKLRVTGEFAE